MMDLYPKNRVHEKEVQRFIVIFYVVGTLGFLWPFTKALFIAITPLALLLNVYLMALYHTSYSKKTLGVFFFVFVAGFFIEVIGVNTGLIFGHYTYGRGLGPKVLNTPLLIGLNWLFMSYASASLLSGFKRNATATIIIAPLLMLAYDLILEQVAPQLDMWAWHGQSVPLQNYVAWYSIAFVFIVLLKRFQINTQNTIAKTLFMCQFVFFVLLMLILK